MTISYWLDQSSVHRQNFDFIILGAGIAGVSAAYWLEKKDPKLKIAVIDKHSLGFGASGRNAGFVTCGSAEHFNKLNDKFGLAKATQIWKFSEENRELLKTEIIQDNFKSVDYTETGSCTVTPSEMDVVRYQDMHRLMSSAGINVEMIDEKYLTEHYGVRGFVGAIQYKRDGIIHPIKLLEKIKSKLKNTTFFFGEEVFKIADQGSHAVVQTQKNTFNAAKVLVCMNGYTSLILPEFRNHVKPQRGQVIVTEPLPSFVKGPCYLTKHLCYFRQLPTGELLVGGFRNHDAAAENTSHDEATEKIQNALTEFTQSYFQKTVNVKINYRWSGVMGFTLDEQMIIGKIPNRDHFHVMAGCAGHGMGLSFNCARSLVHSVFGEKVPWNFDIARIGFS